MGHMGHMGRAFAALVIVGCGDNANDVPPNGPPDDASPDTVEADRCGVNPNANPGPVTLTISDGAVGKPGIEVYFQSSDSSVIAMVTTDQAGVASAAMPPGGFVTAIAPFELDQGKPTNIPPPTLLKSFACVMPGDQLVMRTPLHPAATEVQVRVQASEEPTRSAVRYFVIPGGCQPGFVNDGVVFTPPTLDKNFLFVGCEPTIDFTLVALDVNFGLVSAIHKTDVALTSNGTIDLRSETYATETATFTYSGVPENGLVSVSAEFYKTGLVYRDRTLTTPSGGTAMATLLLPVLGSTRQVTRSDTSTQSVVEWGPSTNAYALDLAPILLSELTDKGFDFATNAVRWTLASGGAQPDLAMTSILFDGWQWDLVGPATSNALRFPVPSSVIGPTNTASAFIKQLLLVRAPGGYDATRALLYSNHHSSGYFTVPDELQVGVAGQLVYEGSF